MARMLPVILIVAVAAGLLFLFVVWSMRKRALIAALGKGLSLVNETLVFGPVPGLYRGTNQHTFGFTGDCVATLTSRRFIYASITGQHEEIPLSDIQTVSENVWFAGQYRNGRQHLILELKDGRKVGFLLRNHSQMLGALRGLLTPSGSLAL